MNTIEKSQLSVRCETSEVDFETEAKHPDPRNHL